MSRKDILMLFVFVLTLLVACVISLCMYVVMFIPLMIWPHVLDGPKEQLVKSFIKMSVGSMMPRKRGDLRLINDIQGGKE